MRFKIKIPLAQWNYFKTGRVILNATRGKIKHLKLISLAKRIFREAFETKWIKGKGSYQ